MPEQPLDEIDRFVNGRKVPVAAGTPETLVATSTRCKWVEVTGLPANTKPVAVGGPGVSAGATTMTGKVLNPGVGTRIDVDDAHQVFVDSQVTGEGVAFLLGLS